MFTMQLGDRLFLDGAFDSQTALLLSQLGVDGVVVNIAGTLEGNLQGKPLIPQTLRDSLRSGQHWTASDLLAVKAVLADHGLKVAALAHTPVHRYADALLGRPGWRTEAAQWCKSLEAMGEAGIDTLIYTWHSNVGARHMNWHTAVDVPIRGGARAEAFRAIDLPESARTAPIQAHEEDLWVALEQFLQACLPAADANGVRMAMHPADPQVPMIAGMPRIMRSESAFDRLLGMYAGPGNAITYCQGCFAQMLTPDGVYRTIEKYVGAGAVALVHFRNVAAQSRPDDFVESFWDHGKIDMVRAMSLYQDHGFTGYLVPDHHPHVEGDTRWGHRSRAFGLGFMRGLMQAAQKNSH
jgi:mannonate dehydratase